MSIGGYYKEKIEICGGNGIVFLRKFIKSHIWQCRLKVNGITGYVYRSCRTKEFDEAIQFARELYDDLQFRATKGLPIAKKTFKEFFEDEWLPYVEMALSIHRYKLHKGIGKLYFLPYFAETPLEEIIEPLIDGYWDWRRDYWKVGPGANIKKGNIAFNPSKKTLQIEQGLLRQMFKYARRKSYISALPIIEMSASTQDTPAKRRPYFTRPEWKQLYLYMDEWQHGGVHSLHRFQRQMLRNFICFLMNSGLRPNEALSLCWKNLDVTEKGRLKIYIPPENKTKERTTIPNDIVARYLFYVRRISNHLEPDDYIFSDKSGKPMDQSHKTFEAVLKKIGILKDRLGNNRTYYSCRHSFIAFRLLEGVPVEDIARNVGTSVKQIEAHYDHIANEMKEDVLTKKISPHFENEWLTSANLFPTIIKALRDDDAMTQIEQNQVELLEVIGKDRPSNK